MNRCLQLAKNGIGNVAPNPMVGAVLVHDDRIIGEGFHRQYGMAHAEVNCINSVNAEDENLISKSILYVSLEPCAHHGKTPPCADLIIKNKIPKVITGCRDPFPQVDGKGIEKLLAAGVEVKTGILEKECKELNERFFTFHQKHRPYIILKWAQSFDGKIAGAASQRAYISNEYTNRLVHKWRSEEAAVMVGTNTALLDDPALTTRLWPGRNPLRLVIDMELKLPSSSNLFDGAATSIVFNGIRNTVENFDDPDILTAGGNLFYQITADVDPVQQVVHALYRLKVQSVIIEGGTKLLQSFIDEKLWDEARVITNESLALPGGLKAPELYHAIPVYTQKIMTDTITQYSNASSFH